MSCFVWIVVLKIDVGENWLYFILEVDCFVGVCSNFCVFVIVVNFFYCGYNMILEMVCCD